MFKTYEMPYKDRVNNFSDAFPIADNAEKIHNALIFIAVLVVLLIVSIIIVLWKDMGKANIVFFLIDFCICILLIFKIGTVIELNEQQQEQKSVLKNNEHHMKYISYDLKGEINQITPKRDDNKENVLILFESENKGYSLELNNDILVKVGDEIRVKSTKKIPTSDKYQINNLNENTPKKVKLNVDIKHNKEWKHYEVKTNENS